MNRRHAASGLLAWAVLVLAGGPAARAQARPVFSSVAVDVAPLTAKGLGAFAEFVGRALQRQLREAYADRIGGRGPRLVVRLDALSLRAYAGSENRLGLGSGSPTDYLEGEALVIGPRGEILARHPQLSAVPSSSGGAWYDPDSENRRVEALAAHFAGWLRRSAI